MIATLPITGFTLVIYSLTIWIISMWVTFITLQRFLQQNKPLNLTNLIDLIFTKSKTQSTNSNATSGSEDCIKQLTKDIDKYFIAKWFTYISKDNTFNDESKIVIEEVLTKMMNVEMCVDNEMIVHGVLNVYLRHLKEFRRSLKRKQKYGGNVSELYRYSHICSNSSPMKRDFFLHQLTINLLNHFINWELSNSLPCRILLATIAKRVTSSALSLFSNPLFLNYYVLHLCASESMKVQLNLRNYSRIQLGNIDDDIILTSVKALSVPVGVTKDSGSVRTPTLSLSNNVVIINNSVATDCGVFSEESGNNEAFNNAVLSPATDDLFNKDADNNYDDELTAKMCENVKIYEPKSCKTWYDSYDLESVTLGQDILDMLNVTDADNNKTSIWGDTDESTSPAALPKSLLHEVKHMTTIEGLKTSMKPISDVTVNTFHNIKDLQETTVNNVVKDVSQVTTNALHKMSGLQDEAAGVVEGLLDFGRTRIRKGLRLTGLQDNLVIEDGIKHQPPPPDNNLKLLQNRPVQTAATAKKNIVKMPRVESEEKIQDENTVWMNPLIQDDDKSVPTIMTHNYDSTHESSPDPEYEETADLATSIAKLRSLLEQKTTSESSNVSTPGLSPMPSSDDFAQKMLLADSVVLVGDGVEDDGVMPSFYKFCAKTATGVIHNTLKNIKTALPSGGGGNAAGNDSFYSGAEKWMFVEANSSDDDLFVRMNKLLSERKVFCTIDTAYEAIDSLGSLQQFEDNNLFSPNSNVQFEDELDDFEVKLPITKALLDIFCELLSDAKSSPFKQEPVIRSILLLLGNYIENNVVSIVNFYTNYLCTNAKIPVDYEISTLTLTVEDYVDALLTGIPNYIQCVLGIDVLKQAITLFINSFQNQKITQDVVMQIFEVISIKLIEGSKQMSPTISLQ